MDYTIFKSRMGTKHLWKERICSASTFDEAFEKLGRIGTVITFEIDPDGHDAADAAVLMGRSLEIFAIERTM